MKNKGFTLIELLAVIVILAILMTILIISVESIINDSEKTVSSLQETKIKEAAKIYYLQEGMNNDVDCINVSELINKGYIENNEVINPETREVMTGSVSITYTSNRHIYKYQENDCFNTQSESTPNITIPDPTDTPNITVTAATSSTKTTGNVPAGNYTASDEYIINIGGANRIFFVLGENSKDSSKVDLIMNQNLGETVAWITQEDFLEAGGSQTDWNNKIRNTYGPVTANKYLASQTSNWEVTPTLPTFEQVRGAYLGTMPIYIYDYLHNTTHPVSNLNGYWTSSPDPDNYISAMYVSYNGLVTHDGISRSGYYGVRPVITIPKSLLG